MAGGGVCSRKRRINALDAEMVINLAELIIILAEMLINHAEVIIILAESVINFAEIPSTIPSMVISACKYALGAYVSDAELCNVNRPMSMLKISLIQLYET